MKKLIFIALFAILGTNLMAQREETIIGTSGWGFSGAWGGWNYNMGNFNKNFSSYQGGLWALEFGKKFYIGGLHYTLNNEPINSSANFSLRSNNLLLGFTPISYRPIHPIISVAVGGSKLRTSTETGEDAVLTLHPAVGFELNVTRWCHIDAQVGYRVVSNSEFTKFTNSDFSGVYGQANLKFGFSWGRYKNKSVDKRD